MQNPHISTTTSWWLKLNTKSLAMYASPDNKVHGANMGPTWVLSAPDGPHVGPMNLVLRVFALVHVRAAHIQCGNRINGIEMLFTQVSIRRRHRLQNISTLQLLDPNICVIQMTLGHQQNNADYMVYIIFLILSAALYYFIVLLWPGGINEKLPRRSPQKLLDLTHRGWSKNILCW